MDAKCPQCGSIYEVGIEDIGVITICESCGKEFEIKAVTSDAHSINTGKKAKPRLHGDVLFIAPTLCRILQYIGNVLSVVVFIALGFNNLPERSNPPLVILLFLACMVGMLISLLIVRLWYEFSIAFFEAVRHLRQIRDKIEISK